jgi:hypothetical protein
MQGIRFQLPKEFLGCNADLVQVAAITELYARRNHVNVKSIHCVVPNVGG